MLFISGAVTKLLDLIDLFAFDRQELHCLVHILYFLPHFSYILATMIEYSRHFLFVDYVCVILFSSIFLVCRVYRLH